VKADVGVPETLADDFDRHPCLEQERGVRVPQVVEGNRRHIELRDLPIEDLAEALMA
jgi:hypothetical protein